MSVLPKRSYLVSDLVASETRFDGSSVAYGYDARANLASVAYPDDTIRFTWDGDGLLASAANAAGTVTNIHDAATGWLNTSRGVDGTAVRYVRSDGGAVTSVVSVAGTTAYALDRAGRRTRIGASAGTLALGYCPWNGLVAAVTNGNGLVASYAYDGLDRLAADGPVSYAYDAAGNRTAKTGDVEGAVDYTRGVGNRLASWTGGTYTYDAAGNVTRIVRDGRPTLDLTWNGRYQLVSVSTNGIFAEGYAYDALGRRASTTTQEGTVWGLSDGTDVVARWTYDAWGNVLSGEVSDPALAAFRYRFQVREFSSATGLTNFRARWYDPGTGRWLSKDPIRLDGGINLYAFCDGDPLNSIDCMGECPVEPPPGTGVLGPPRRSPSGTTYRADPFGHGVNPETNVPLDPHVHQIPRRGKPRIFDMDGTPRGGGPKIPKADVGVFLKAVSDIMKFMPRMPLMMIVTPPGQPTFSNGVPEV